MRLLYFPSRKFFSEKFLGRMASIDSIFASLQSNDKHTREQAESHLHSHEIMSGFADRLLSVGCDQGSSLPNRQLSLTLIKELIRNRWHELQDPDRRQILSRLLSLVFDPKSSLRKLCHACIALAASRAGIQNWIELLDTISSGLAAPTTSQDARISLLDLLASIIEEVGGSALSQVLPQLTQALVQAAQPALPLSVVRKSFSVYTTLLVNIALDEDTTALASADFSPWIPVLTSLAKSSDVADIISVLRNLKLLVSHNLETLTGAVLEPLVIESVRWLETSRQVFQSLVILGEEGGIDEDEDNGGLASLVVAVCELLTAVASNDISTQLLGGRLDRMFSAMAPFLQISVSNEQEWLLCPSDFIANEQDDFAAITIRLSFEGLVADLLESPFLIPQVVAAMMASAISIIEEGMHARRDENSEWWRLVEAGLFVFSFLGSEYASEFRDRSIEVLRGCAQFCSGDSVHPLLKARSFSVLARLCTLTAQVFGSDLVGILKCSVDSMADEQIVVAFCASGAFNAFLPMSTESPERLNPLILGETGALASLARMARTGVEETVHFSLEGLIRLTAIRPDVLKAAGVADEYCRFLSESLVERVDDPIAPDQILTLVQNAQLGVSPAEFEALAQMIAGSVKKWLHIDAENRLDVALEFLEVIAQHSVVPYSGNVLECVLILNDGELAQIGPETSERIGNILRVCAIRGPGNDGSPGSIMQA